MGNFRMAKNMEQVNVGQSEMFMKANGKQGNGKAQVSSQVLRVKCMKANTKKTQNMDKVSTRCPMVQCMKATLLESVLVKAFRRIIRYIRQILYRFINVPAFIKANSSTAKVMEMV